MRIGELILIGLGLSMDAAAVAIADTLAYPGLNRKNRLAIPAAFALFQALMPVAGYLAGNLFAGLLSRYTGPVSLAVLGAIGLNMVREGLAAPEGSASAPAEPPKAAPEGAPPASAPAGPPPAAAAVATAPARQLRLPVLLAQALATSIDALAVGVLFAARPGGILPAAAIIGLTTLLCSFAALQLGRRFGALLGRRAQVLGGLILIALGVKALF